MRAGGLAPLSNAGALFGGFGGARFTPSGSVPYYLDGLECCGSQLRREVTASVAEVLTMLADVLAKSVSTPDRFGLCLVALNGWGLRIRDPELGLLARVRLFSTMQSVLSAVRDANDVELSVRSQVEQACIKLLCALVAQVVSHAGSDSATPATSALLSSSVFKMLYEELARRVDNHIAKKLVRESQLPALPDKTRNASAPAPKTSTALLPTSRAPRPPPAAVAAPRIADRDEPLFHASTAPFGGLGGYGAPSFSGRPVPPSYYAPPPTFGSPFSGGVPISLGASPYSTDHLPSAAKMPPPTFPSRSVAPAKSAAPSAPAYDEAEGDELDEQDVFMDEAMTLLYSVSASPACSRELGTSEWLNLLLRMAHAAPLAVQRRTMRILRKLVPLVRPVGLKVTIPSGLATGTSQDAAGVIAYVLSMIQDALCPAVLLASKPACDGADDAAAAGLLDPSHVNAQKSSEAIALARALLNVRVRS